MKTIWKYQLTPVPGPITVTVQSDCRFIHADVQKGSGCCVWAEVNPEAGTTEVEFFIIGTGHQVPPETFYLGTSQNGPFVWHMYWRNKSKSD